ncbi:glycosyltransferase family 4 protein [Actinomyces sp. MRS3W]|uniref:glycosyltransferase family 4 protein n=1 Tax=Actinomyces sp. MRS3W TaxID=2800796 RepID=UPI0028FD6A21|nr:glycosyltransferase family 4 protein [Actinomyces sp. MRS3W]MDU0347529.1 glycosyltransferase family 4 protein [Actinomyces sp. MRS3W]
MTRITLAANNAEIGGGEVMLLALASALRELGHEVAVVAPAHADGVGVAAARMGLPTTAIRGSSRREYLAGLRRWDAARRQGVLWCNGHVPALATTGRPNRIVHLHQAPSLAHVAAGRLAGAGALVTLVPSWSMARHFPGAQVLPNWVEPVPVVAQSRGLNPPTDAPVTLGFLGRLSPSKGVVVLAQALAALDAAAPGRYRLLLAGEPRFVPEADRAVVEAALAPVAHLVERPGWMDRAEFFARVDMAVFPSVQEETFGLMAAEAMSARVPFIVSDAGALPEVVGADYPWLSHAGSVADLAAMIARLATAPAAQTAAVVQRMYERWEERFSPAAGLRHLRFLLMDVLPAGGAA